MSRMKVGHVGFWHVSAPLHSFLVVIEILILRINVTSGNFFLSDC